MAYYDDEIWDEWLPVPQPVRRQRPIETVELPALSLTRAQEIHATIGDGTYTDAELAELRSLIEE